MKTIFTVLVFFASTAQAFIDVEAVRRQATDGFVGKSSLTGSGQSGNTDRTGFNLSTLNMQRFEKTDLLFLGDLNFSKVSNNEDTNNGRAHIRDTYLPKEPLSYEFFVQTEYDRFRKLKLRTLLGSNLRHRLAVTREQNLYAGYGIFHEWQTWSDGKDHDGWRGNLYISYAGGLIAAFTGSVTVYYQPALKQLSDYRLRYQSALESTITERLAMKIELAINTETVNAEGVKPTDVFYGAGFTLKY